MNEIATVLEPVVPPRATKSRQTGHELRREVHNMLRDVAFVLAQTHRVREEILHEQPTYRLGLRAIGANGVELDRITITKDK